MAQPSKRRRRTKVAGEHHLYERTTASGERVFEVAWRDHDGRRHFRTVRGGIMRARAERDRIIGARANGERQADPRLTFAKAADQYLEYRAARDLHATTKADERRIVERHLLPGLGRQRLADIGPDDLVRLLGELRAGGLGERSLKLALNVVSRIYRHAGRRGFAGQNPVALLDRDDRPNDAPQRRRVFEGTELEETIAAAHEPARTLFKLLAATGCRVSEALALRWSDLHLDGDPYVVFAGQLDRKGTRRPLKCRDGRETREVPVPAELAEELRAHAARSTTPGEYVFATRTGRPLSQRNVARSLRAAQKAACRPDGTPTFPVLHERDEHGRPARVERGKLPSLHSFRHTFASRYIFEAGQSADEVAALLGHRDATVTRVVYAHELDNAGRRGVRRDTIAALFGDAIGA